MFHPDPLVVTPIPPKYPIFMFINCLVSPNECPLASNCLRHIAWQKNAENPEISQSLKIEVLNPAHPAINYATDHCRAYIDATPVTYARGMSGLFDSVPHDQYKQVRDEVQACFSCRSFFFRSKSGKRRITPQEQQKIAAVFAAHNLPAPTYQSTETDYDWQAPINI